MRSTHRGSDAASGPPWRWVVAALAVAVLGGSCATADPSPARVSPSPTSVETTIPAAVPDALADLEQRIVTLDGTPFLVAVAATPAKRATGLMGVTDLGDLAGMLFVFEETISGSFWMKDTLIPLDIAFFDAAGGFLRALTMVPCEAEPCATYSADAPFRYAVEMPAGTMPSLSSGSVLDPGA